MVSSNPAYHTSSPTVGNQQSSNNTLASVDDQALSYQDESYEDYGQYEVDQSYDGSMAEAGIMNTSVAEGNKGKHLMALSVNALGVHVSYSVWFEVS